LSGSKTSRSRFGFALAPAGDLNLDGFNGISQHFVNSNLEFNSIYSNQRV